VYFYNGLEAQLADEPNWSEYFAIMDDNWGYYFYFDLDTHEPVY
jgi:hypothetical protein